MTSTEISWAKSQTWWNDFTNLYAHSTWALEVNFVDYIHDHSLEMVALNLINDENLNDTDNMILARITNACLDYVGTSDIQEYSAPVIKSEKKPKAMRASVELEKVLSISCWSELRTSEKEDILHRRLPELGFTWDVSQEYNGTLFLYKRVIKLSTLR